MHNKGYYAVQGHSGSVPIEGPYVTSYWWLILTYILSRTVSKIIVQILEEQLSLCIFDHPYGAFRAMYAVHLKLIEKPIVDFLFVLGLLELFC